MRRILSIGLTLACVAALLAFAASPVIAAPARQEWKQPKGSEKIIQTDRLALARFAAREQGAAIVVLSAVGHGAELAKAVRDNGGTVTSVDDKAGWVAARIPAARALDLEKEKVVRTLGLDRKVSIPKDPTERPNASRPDASPPGRRTGAVNSYLPTGDIGAPQFVRRHRGFDGRGVKLAVLDTGVDWEAPGLVETSTGGRKVTRWADTTGEGAIRTDQVVAVSGNEFSADGETWTLPGGLTVQTVRFGTFSEEDSLAPATADNDLAQDINRDGDNEDVFGVAVVNSAERGLTIHFDTNQNHSFADEDALADYNTSHTSDEFGTDNPATGGVEEVVNFAALACTATIDNPCRAALTGTAGDRWTVAFDGGTHGTNVASIAAGNDLEIGGARFDGVAPGAEVWAVRVLTSQGSSTSSSVGLGIVRAASQGADIINMSLGGLPVINVGAPLDPSATLVDNVTEAYGVTFAIAAGNDGAGINTVGSPGTAASAVTAGAYIAPKTWDTNYDRPRVPNEGLFYFSSIGPLEDGAYKPDIVAPGSAMAAVPSWLDYTFDIFPVGALPAGWAVFQGTSMASPQAAGAEALLISAAKQEGTEHTPHTVKRALELGAREVDGGTHDYQPAEVGHGLIQVGRAWRWLQRLGTTDRDIASQTENFVLGVGQGAYQREEFKTELDYLLGTFSPGGHLYRLSTDESWLRTTPREVFVPGSPGNDPDGNPLPGVSAFQARFASSLANRPGLHSGVITADDRSTRDPADLEILNTVVTPYEFTAGNSNTWDFRGRGRNSGIEAEKVERFFFRVPENAGALQLSALSRAAERSGLVVYVTDPLGVPYTTNTDAFVPGGRANVTIANPAAGVWEVDLHARERAVLGVDERPRSHPVTPFHGYDLTVKLLSVSLDPAAWTIEPAVPGQTYTQAFTATNQGAAFTGRAAGTALVRSARERKTIGATDGEQQYPVEVPAGTTELVVKIANPSDTGADLDLYVYDPSGELFAFDADGDSNETVVIPNPAVGDWTVGVDPFEVPSGSTEFDYQVDLALPGLGEVTTDDTDAEHPTGSTWTFTASVTAPTSPPPAGSVYAGRVTVLDSSGAEISGAPVTLRY